MEKQSHLPHTDLTAYRSTAYRSGSISIWLYTDVDGQRRVKGSAGMGYRMTIQVKAPFDRTVAWVTEALREQGFGVLTTIDVQATLHAKVGMEMEQYIILGACNPALTQRALEADRGVGLLLPCNVVIRADGEHHGDGDRVVVEAVDPNALAGVSETGEFEPVAREAARRLASALATVAAVGR